MTTAIKTKYGTATLDKQGYYQLTTNQGKHSRRLHRRIWEDHYNKPIPNGYVIHHMNGDRLDNRIQNLQCCKREDHIKFHSKGRTFQHTEEFKKIRSEKYSGKGNPMYGKKRSREEMKGLISHMLKSSKLSFYDNFYGLVYLMHRKNAGLTQREIINEMGCSSSSYIAQKLKRVNMSWRDL